MTSSPSPTPPQNAPGPWSDPLGRAGARAGQILLVAAVVVGAVWLLLRVTVVVVSVLVALILAAAVAPLVRWLLRKGWSHLSATLLSFVGIVVVAGGVVGAIVLAIRSEWDTLAESAVASWEQLKDWVVSGPLEVDAAAIDGATQQITDSLSGSDVASSTLIGVTAATQFVTGILLTIVLLFFFLKDGGRISSFALRWFRGGTRAKLAESIDRSSAILGGYVRGTATVALVDAVLIGIGLAVVGVPLAVPLAVVVFIGAFIPVVGATVTGILAAGVTLVTNGPWEALIVVVIVVAVNQIEGNLLQPFVMGRTLSLHPLIVLLALTIGTIVGGIFGAILAVPYTAMAWALIQIWTDRYQTGDDPILGPDPLGPRDRAKNKSSATQRVKYQLLRTGRGRTGGADGEAGGAEQAGGAGQAGAAEQAGGDGQIGAAEQEAAGPDGTAADDDRPASDGPGPAGDDRPAGTTG